jgi:hypothetical protein
MRGTGALEQSLDSGQCLTRESEQASGPRKIEIIDDVDEEQRNRMRWRSRASDGRSQSHTHPRDDRRELPSGSDS